MNPCRPGRCHWPKRKRVVVRRYFGSLRTYAEITVGFGTVCERDGVCWLVERERIREQFAADAVERHAAHSPSFTYAGSE